MVYTPRSYLIPAAVALVALQVQQATGTSLFYDPFTSADTTDEISSKFPARGAKVADKDCAITVEVDPTLPDIATISTVTVTYSELLANSSTAPTESVSTKVGTLIYSVDTPATSADQDAYTTTTTTSTSTSTSTTSTTQTSTTSSAGGTKTMSTKTGTTVSQQTASTSTTTSTTKSGAEAATTAPATTSSSVGGSSSEEQTSTSSSTGGTYYEDTTSTASPTKTGVTTAPASTSVDASSDEDTAATVSPSKTGVTTATVSPAKTGITTAPATKTGVTTAPAATTAAPTKTGVTTAPASKPTDVEGTSAKDCATGWEDQSSRKLRHSPMSGRRLQEKVEKKRRLEANTNKDIAKLEAYFGTSMEVNLAKLPTVGVHTPSPWPGPYWPTYQDGINVIWSPGEPSAAEKYATAFGLDATDFMDKVSKDNGIDSMSSHTVCSSDSDCSSLTDGSSCAIRTGKTSGYCIPTWYGICHAWTPAAMLEAEPNCAVTYNGVTFQPLDIKALLSDVYDGATVSTVFTGTRYNGGSDSTDSYGRHSSDSYRDLNPAYFHIASANLLGKLNATFIADVTAGSEVWNQPVRGFKVYEQTNMTLSEAASTFYGLDEYPWNAAAKSIVYVKSRLSWIFETYTDGGLVKSGKVDSYTTGAYYTYILEMDDDGNIIGGEWVYDSDDDHPDFIWFPKAKPAADTVTSIGLSYADVSMLLEKSVACEGGSSSGSTAAGSAQSSTSASTAASNTGSTAFSSQPGSASTGSTAASTTDSNNAATVAPVTEAPTTEVPVATESTTNTGTAAPATTTATPSTNQWVPSNQGSGSGRGWLSFFHWW